MNIMQGNREEEEEEGLLGGDEGRKLSFILSFLQWFKFVLLRQWKV